MDGSSTAYVVFPCDHGRWKEVKTCLKNILQYPPESGDLLIEKLQHIYNILHEKTKKTSNVFDGLQTYLSDCHWQKRELFMTRVLPFIIQGALEVEKLKPDGGLETLKQGHDTTVCLPRRLVTCIVACSFLALWPGRKFERRSCLNSINFDNFFQHCKTDSGQCAKLDCFLHFFDEQASDLEEMEGSIVFHRQVLKPNEVLSMTQWAKSTQPLCPFEVHATGRIEDAGPNILQVDFANRRIGGGAVSKGKVQEEIRFSICPELISGQLFVEAMTEHESIVIQGFKNYCDYTGYARTLKYNGPFPETAQRDALGNLENYLVAIDAVSFKRLGGPEVQYEQEHLLRDLNKAYIGFKQDFLHYNAKHAASKGEEGGPMSNIVENYFSTLSEDIFTLALQETLVSLQESSSNSSAATHSSGHGQNGRTIPDPIDLMGATLDYARRRSSNLSDISSRRSSSAGSRRSSGTQLTSSECGSELEEYYQAYQARYNLKPSVIKEETGDGDMQEFASQIVKSIFGAGIEKAKEMEPAVKEFSSDQLSESVVKPKVHKLTPVSHSLEPGQGKSSRRKSPVRWKEPIQKEESEASTSFDLREEIEKMIGPMVSLKFQDDTSEKAKEMPVKPADQALPAISPVLPDSCNTSLTEFHLTVNEKPDRVESFSKRLSEYIMYQALRDISEMYRSESQSEASCELSNSNDKRVSCYIGGMMQSVMYNVRKNFGRQQEQEMWTSDSEIDHDLDLYIYADDFVQTVLHEAVDLYRVEKREEQQGLENMWQKSLEKFETDAKYFEAEFSRYWKNNSPRERYFNPKSRVQYEMLRRRSLDETSRGLMHQKAAASGFRDFTLSNFEKELLKSAGNISSKGPILTNFEQELLSVHPSSAEVLFYSGLRRSSEPAPTHRLSFDAACHPSLRLQERRRGSSACSTSSREMILDWLNQSQRSSSSSTGSRRRTRTTSSHLDWYAQDLLLEAFNDALKEIFGDVHVHINTGTGGDLDSGDNSFCSSQSADVCDTYISIPVNSSSSISNNNNISSSSNSNNASAKSNENIKLEDFSEHSHLHQQGSAVLLSSTPTEGSASLSFDTRHYQNVSSNSDSNNYGGARPKRVKKSGKKIGHSGSSIEKAEFLEGHNQREHERLSPSRVTTVPSRSSPISAHLMEGMCENLSNEVIEGARSSFTHRGDRSREEDGHRGVISRPEDSGQQTECTVDVPEIKLMPIATGNWGCGAYRGDPQLKSLLQWAAASSRQAPLVMYYTFNDERVEQLEDITQMILHHALTVGDLVELITWYCDRRLKTKKYKKTLFEFIRNALNKKSK